MPIVLVGGEHRSGEHAAEFENKLQAYDKDLLVVWHKPPHWPRRRPGVWKIEQCVRHFGGTKANGLPDHTHVCQRICVLMVQDDDGTPMPLGERVIEKIKAMRAYSESFGGQTERGLRNFIQHSNNIDAELEAKRDEKRRDLQQYNRRYHRVQLNKFQHALEQHDIFRPNR